MKRFFLKHSTCALVVLALLPFTALSSSAATQREHLTPAEIELVRDNQALDARMAVFVRAIERRLEAISAPNAPEAATAKGSEKFKESEKWGELPKSTRPQLIHDIARILEEAVTNIEDASIHSEKSSLIPKALRKLAEAGNRFLPRLTALREGTENEAERDLLEQAIESTQEVIDAAARLPEEATTKKKKS